MSVILTRLIVEKKQGEVNTHLDTVAHNYRKYSRSQAAITLV